MKIHFSFLIIFLIFLESGVSSAALEKALPPLLPVETPFWKAKPKVYAKIRDENAIIVSVNAAEEKADPKKPNIMRMQGGGIISTPQQFAFDRSRDFSNLKKVSSHVRRADYNAKDQTLDLRTEAFNYTAIMKLKIERVENSSEKAIAFKVIEGHFLGMEGKVSFIEVTPIKSEIGFSAGYRYDKLPFPQFFVEFGLEVVIQKIAALLRTNIENQYQESRRKK